MDGVLANTEPYWEAAKAEVFNEFLNPLVVQKMGPTMGLNMDSIYNLAVECGASLDKEALISAFYAKAHWVYENAALTPNVEELGRALQRMNYAIAIVSASPTDWMSTIVGRLPFRESIRHLISLEDRKDLAHKPAPDGYLEAMRELGSGPETTIILEDSNTGIASAKASGAYTIGLRENLIEGYVQEGADTYVENMGDVLQILENREKASV